MIGGFFIIDDPIFGGLAISLIFGLLVSTILTLVVIPVVYYAVMYKKQHLLMKKLAPFTGLVVSSCCHLQRYRIEPV